MRNIQIIHMARGLDDALSVVRDEMVYIIKDETIQKGVISCRCKCKQFIDGTPYEATGVTIKDGIPFLVLPGYYNIPLEEASTPILIEIMEKITYNDIQF